MGTLGKGRSTGSNAQYDISNLHFYRDGEDIGIAEFFGVDSSSIDKASTMVVATLTTPKKAAKGNLIGTWGFSAKAAGLTITEMQMTMQTGGTWTGSMKSAGDDKAEQFGGTWVSQGGSTYHINETQSYNSEFDVTLPSGRQH